MRLGVDESLSRPEFPDHARALPTPREKHRGGRGRRGYATGFRPEKSGGRQGRPPYSSVPAHSEDATVKTAQSYGLVPLLFPEVFQMPQSATLIGESSANLRFPEPWVRCVWCKRVVPYGSREIVPIWRGGTVYAHPDCQRNAELAEWSKEASPHRGEGLASEGSA